jgi:hypothetical protein
VTKPMQAKGKPKYPATTGEQETIVTLAAAGVSPNKISHAVGRSRHLVRNTLAKPEIARAVEDEKAELAEIYREKARTIVVSISNADIANASLQQKAISSGILLDKSLLLSGQPTNINFSVLLDVVEAMRSRPLQTVALPHQAPALPQPEL